MINWVRFEAIKFIEPSIDWDIAYKMEGFSTISTRSTY